MKGNHILHAITVAFVLPLIVLLLVVDDGMVRSYVLFSVILFFIIRPLVIQEVRKDLSDPKIPLKIDIVDEILHIKCPQKPKSRFEWSLKLDDILLITASKPDSYYLKLKTNTFNADSRERKGQHEIVSVESYKYLHFFDTNGKEFILNLFSHPEGMKQVFDILDEKFGVNRKQTEEIEKDSKMLFPIPPLGFEPHNGSLIDGDRTFLSILKIFFFYSHPKAAILKKETILFAKEERLLQEIGKHT